MEERTLAEAGLTDTGFWGIVEESIVKSRFIDNVVEVIDNNIDLCPSVDFKIIWENASNSFKSALAQRIADYYVEHILTNYCFI